MPVLEKRDALSHRQKESALIRGSRATLNLTLAVNQHVTSSE